MLRSFLFLIVTLALQACGVRAPIVNFTGATISESTPEAIALAAEFEISNTNDEPLRLEYYNYTVTAGGRTVYHGTAAAELTVPRWAFISSTIPIVIRREDIHTQEAISWNLSGSVSYIPPTALAETLLRTGIWKPTTSIRANGTLEAYDIE